jgi:hypothetical protein
MKKAIFFLILNCTIFFACKKENTNECSSQKDGKSFEYIEKDTASSFLNKKTFLIVESLNCSCTSGCVPELRIRNLIDKEIEIKVFQDSTFNTLFTTETLSTTWYRQKSFGTKSSIEEFTKFMKVSYK